MSLEPVHDKSPCIRRLTDLAENISPQNQEVSSRIIEEILLKKSQDVIGELMDHPEEAKEYRALGARLRKIDEKLDTHLFKDFQFAIGAVQKIARLLNKNDGEGLDKFIAQFPRVDGKHNNVAEMFHRFSLPKDLNAIRSISHPNVRTHVLASLINLQLNKMDNKDMTTFLRDTSLSFEEFFAVLPNLTKHVQLNILNIVLDGFHPQDRKRLIDEGKLSQETMLALLPNLKTREAYAHVLAAVINGSPNQDFHNLIQDLPQETMLALLPHLKTREAYVHVLATIINGSPNQDFHNLIQDLSQETKLALLSHLKTREAYIYVLASTINSLPVKDQIPFIRNRSQEEMLALFSLVNTEARFELLCRLKPPVDTGPLIEMLPEKQLIYMVKKFKGDLPSSLVPLATKMIDRISLENHAHIPLELLYNNQIYKLIYHGKGNTRLHLITQRINSWVESQKSYPDHFIKEFNIQHHEIPVLFPHLKSASRAYIWAAHMNQGATQETFLNLKLTNKELQSAIPHLKDSIKRKTLSEWATISPYLPLEMRMTFLSGTEDMFYPYLLDVLSKEEMRELFPILSQFPGKDFSNQYIRRFGAKGFGDFLLKLNISNQQLERMITRLDNPFRAQMEGIQKWLLDINGMSYAINTAPDPKLVLSTLKLTAERVVALYPYLLPKARLHLWSFFGVSTLLNIPDFLLPSGEIMEMLDKLQGSLPHPRDRALREDLRTLALQSMLPKKLQRVPWTSLREHPSHVLLELGTSLLSGQGMPNIRFIEKSGMVSQHDEGEGLMRIFISSLMEGLLSRSNAPDSLFDRDDPLGALPVLNLTAENAEAQREGFRVLGAIFAECLSKPYVTGNYFNPALFRLITAFSYEELDSLPPDATDLSDSLRLHLLQVMRPETRKTVEILQTPLETITALQFATLKEELLANYSLKELQEKEHVPSLNEPLSEKAKQWLHKKAMQMYVDERKNSDVLLPIALIAKQMQILARTPEQWNHWCALGPEKLQTRIEGVVSQDGIKAAMELSLSPTVNEKGELVELDARKVARTEAFILKWIEEPDNHKNLKDLLFTMTGSTALPAGIKLKFGLFNRDPEHIPMAHTCFSSIEIPITYPDYETFKAKLDVLIQQSINPEHSGVNVDVER